MQFPPSVWGPFFWHTIHIVALGYPKSPTNTDKKCAKEDHYKEHLAKNPLTPFLDSRKDLIKWMIDIHNAVNKILGKAEWTEEEVIIYYERLGRRDRSPVWTREDMKEVDYRSFVKGFITGSAILAGIGGVVYFINRL